MPASTQSHDRFELYETKIQRRVSKVGIEENIYKYLMIYRNRCRHLQKRKLQLAQSGRAQLQKEQRQQRKVRNPKASNACQTLFFCFMQGVEYSLEYDTLLHYFFRLVCIGANLVIIAGIGI